MSSARPRPRRKAPATAQPPSALPKAPNPVSTPPALVTLVKAAMDDMKAVNVKILNVIGLTDIADYMIVAAGNSDRHVKSIAERVVQQAKAAGKRPYGMEGEQDGEWVLVDLPDVMVHVMLPRVREFYALEELWDNAPRIAVPEAAAPRKARKTGAAASGRGKPRGKKAAARSRAVGGARSSRKPRG